MSLQETERTELSTLYAIYDYLRNGNPPPQNPISEKSAMQDVNPEISHPADKLATPKISNGGIFPSLTSEIPIPPQKINWVFTFQTNGPALEKYLKSHGWSNYNDLKIGIFDNNKVAAL